MSDTLQTIGRETRSVLLAPLEQSLDAIPDVRDSLIHEGDDHGDCDRGRGCQDESDPHRANDLRPPEQAVEVHQASRAAGHADQNTCQPDRRHGGEEDAGCRAAALRGLTDAPHTRNG